MTRIAKILTRSIPTLQPQPDEALFGVGEVLAEEEGGMSRRAPSLMEPETDGQSPDNSFVCGH